jgi:hypothetical protein
MVFQAPVLFVALFYGVLLAWTVGTVPPIVLKFQRGGFQGDWLFAAMLGFFYLYTWFWALGIFYRITLDGEGKVVLKSLRRNLRVSAKQIFTIQGSRFPGGFGFIRVKLPRESGYLFCYRKGPELEEIFKEIQKLNPLAKTDRL